MAAACFVVRISMKSPRLLVAFVLLLLFLSLNQVCCEQNYVVEYQIQINSDLSASWIIMVVSDVNATVDSWESFQQKIFLLVEAAANVTGREMAIAPETINMETTISWETQSKTTQFSFKWLNFSVPEGEGLLVADVFSVPSFFGWLYGDGRLLITYPVGYSLLEVSPSPDKTDIDTRKMEWFRTQDFLNGSPSVLVGADDSSSGSGWVSYLVLGLVLASAVIASLAWFFFFRRRRLETVHAAEAPAGITLSESDEDRVIKFLRSSGGSVHQSSVNEQFGFSKAKTSQLLSSLERKGVVARYKSGRDKIVTLTERSTGDK